MNKISTTTIATKVTVNQPHCCLHITIITIGHITLTKLIWKTARESNLLGRIFADANSLLVLWTVCLFLSLFHWYTLFVFIEPESNGFQKKFVLSYFIVGYYTCFTHRSAIKIVHNVFVLDIFEIHNLRRNCSEINQRNITSNSAVEYAFMYTLFLFFMYA